ncbi:hypothetical protein DFP73DRAFT_624685 [Morchella snyderi]|nr:hypothetical protein DFP73DRAFT_624685 [Morchella snyderi]
MPSSTPTHVFIVRHGARLDMADAQWQLTSPTPYDPPLTYGGWTQTRSLGSRIATLIASKLNTPHPASTTTSRPSGRPRKIRIVIHSSPFLRCVQTSVSIASGIAQHHHQEVTNTHYVYADGELAVEPAPHDRSEHQFVKPLLRLDAWLGEWLAEDYYTDITPPPPTPLLVGTAKADYIRPSSSSSHIQHHASSLYNMSSLATALPPAFTGGFVAPTPTWATSPNGQIPRGHFSHAKEYAEFDIGWDSTKLGGGGEYKEEWTSMHKRFKNGWNRLLWYYATEDQHVATSPTQWKRCAAAAVNELVVSKPVPSRTPTPAPTKKEHPQQQAPVNGNPTPPLSDCGDDDNGDCDDDEADIETVLVLVTHGAGCNALIGAITHQPVLIDIGIASVTMAVRRDYDSSHHHHHSHSAPPQPTDTTPPAKYSLQIVANNEHIRTGATPNSTPPVSPHLRSTHTSASSTSKRTIGVFTLAPSGATAGMTMFGHGKRSASTASTGPAPKGLWSRPVGATSKEDESSVSSSGSGSGGSVSSGIFGSSSMLFGSAIDGGSSSEDDDEEAVVGGGGGRRGTDIIAEEPAAGTGLWGSTSVVRGSGLWGGSGAAPAAGAGWERKRRWTASTRSEFQN